MEGAVIESGVLQRDQRLADGLACWTRSTASLNGSRPRAATAPAAQCSSLILFPRVTRGGTVVAVMAMLALTACSWRPNAAPVVDDDKVASSERSEQGTGEPPPSDPDPTAAWIREVDEACRYGLVMYPSVRLGSRAEVDTMEYGFRELYSSVSRIAAPDDPVLREQVSRLMTQASNVAATWHELALRPPLLSSQRDSGQASSVSVGEKRAAAQETRSFILGLADIGATACSELAPAE